MYCELFAAVFILINLYLLCLLCLNRPVSGTVAKILRDSLPEISVFIHPFPLDAHDLFDDVTNTGFSAI